MSNDTLSILQDTQKKYDTIVQEIQKEANNIGSLSLEEIEQFNKELKELEEIVHRIKMAMSKITKKIYKQKALNDKNTKAHLKDKKSFEYNEILLSQGKQAKAIVNLEKRAKEGDVNAQLLIGKTYLHGVIGAYDNVKMKDVGLGLKWLTVAYKNGSDEAGFLIALHERAVFNVVNSIKLLEKLGRKGHLESLNELSYIYKNDPKYGNLEKLLDIKQRIKSIS